MVGAARIFGNTLATIVSVLIPGLMGLWSLKPLLELLGAETFTMLSFFWVYTSHLGFFVFVIFRILGLSCPNYPTQKNQYWSIRVFEKDSCIH